MKSYTGNFVKTTPKRSDNYDPDFDSDPEPGHLRCHFGPLPISPKPPPKSPVKKIDERMAIESIGESFARIFLLTQNDESRQKAYQLFGVNSNLDFSKTVQAKLTEFIERSKSKRRVTVKRKSDPVEQPDFSEDEDVFSDTDEPIKAKRMSLNNGEHLDFSNDEADFSDLEVVHAKKATSRSKLELDFSKDEADFSDLEAPKNHLEEVEFSD